VNFLDLPYIKKGAVEDREYQMNLAQQAATENCIVVLPTGLGKTTVALRVISEYLRNAEAGVLFLAPTRVLVSQHYEFLKNMMTIQDISVVTGSDVIKKRSKLWNNSIVCATPEITRNDLNRSLISPSQFGLAIFDEVHRTVGDYAYSTIAEKLVSANTKILGMTATLPDEIDKATEIMKILRIQNVAKRDESSPDVLPYIQQTRTRQVKVQLTPEMNEIRTHIKAAQELRYADLRSAGVKLGTKPTLTDLLEARQYVLTRAKYAAKPLFTAIRITYALNMFEIHGVTTFLKFCERTAQKGGAGTKELLEFDPNFTAALRGAKKMQAAGEEHPKIRELYKIVKNIPGKMLIFSSYRDSLEVIRKSLERIGVPAVVLVGQAGETGLKKREQIEVVEKFRSGEYRVLLATRVGEEGLDIAEVNDVIFYDNVPSSIRYIQRRGRTGRKQSGNLTVLIAAGTMDEVYNIISKRKIKKTKDMADSLGKSVPPSGLDTYM